MVGHIMDFSVESVMHRGIDRDSEVRLGWVERRAYENQPEIKQTNTSEIPNHCVYTVCTGLSVIIGGIKSTSISACTSI